MLLLVLAATTLNTWPGNISKVEGANMVTGVSPLATPIHNLWGAPKNEKVDLTLAKTDNSVSWTWSRPDPVKKPGISYVQPIYPSARITLKTPVEVSEIKSFNLFADYNYTQKPAGSYNLAFDIFLREKGKSGDNRKSEIMIWLAASKECPARKDGEYNINGSAYSLCVNTDWNPGVTYMAFVLEGESIPQRLPIHEFIKIAIQKGYVDPDAYLAAVELGPEIWWGEGEASLRDYRLLIKVD